MIARGSATAPSAVPSPDASSLYTSEGRSFKQAKKTLSTRPTTATQAAHRYRFMFTLEGIECGERLVKKDTQDPSYLVKGSP